MLMASIPVASAMATAARSARHHNCRSIYRKILVAKDFTFCHHAG
jgi:hypothetical protein